MKRFLGVVFACVAAVVLSISASAAESPPAQEAEASQDPLDASGFWDRVDLDNMTSQEMDDAICEVLLEAGYTEEVSAHSIEEISEGIPQEIYDLAYSDIDQADEETKAEILKARNWFIYSCSWSDDGTGILYSDIKRTFSRTPKFSDLFPEWDIPVAEDYAGKNQAEPAPAGESSPEPKSVQNEEKKNPSSNARSEARPTVENEFLPQTVPEEISENCASASVEPRATIRTFSFPSVHVKQKVAGSGLTPAFTSFVTAMQPNIINPIRVKVNALPAKMLSCNIGLTNEQTGGNIYYRNDVEPGDTFAKDVNSSEYGMVGIRVSTKYNSGYGNFSVTRRDDGA